MALSYSPPLFNLKLSNKFPQAHFCKSTKPSIRVTGTNPLSLHSKSRSLFLANDKGFRTPSRRPKIVAASPGEAESFSSETAQQEAFAWSSVILPFVFPALGGLLFGYDIGATSGAAISLQSPELSGTDWFNFSAVQLGLVVSGSLYGALLGSLIVYPLADFLGRKRELIFASLLYASGGLLTAFSPGLGVLLIGRLLYGLGIGMAMHGAPLYIAETCPSQIRGTLISLKELFIVLGILEYKEKAIIALRKLRGGSVDEKSSEKQIEDALVSLKSAYFDQESEGSIFDVFQGSSLKAFINGGGLVLFQQITGQPSVLYYAGPILQFLMTGVAVLKVDDVGRRPLLIGGVGGLAFSLLLLSAYYKFLGGFPFVAVAALLLYVGCHQISFRPISWLMVSEIFPLRTRGKGITWS